MDCSGGGGREVAQAQAVDPVFEHIARHREAAAVLAAACNDLLATSDQPDGANDEEHSFELLERLAAAEFSVLKQFEATVPTTLAGLFAKLIYIAETCRHDPETSSLYDIRVLLTSLADAALALRETLPPM